MVQEGNLTLMQNFKINLKKETFNFAAAHLITYGAKTCEKLHGHNYRVSVMLTGELDPENGYVYDFVFIKPIIKKIVDKLDHCVLLAQYNKFLKIKEEKGQIKLFYKSKEYFFPRSDVVLLPIENTTVELLAQYINPQLYQELQVSKHGQITVLEIEVEESFGQSASFRKEY